MDSVNEGIIDLRIYRQNDVVGVSADIKDGATLFDVLSGLAFAAAVLIVNAEEDLKDLDSVVKNYCGIFQSNVRELKSEKDRIGTGKPN